MKIKTKFNINDEVEVKSLDKETGKLVSNSGKITGLKYQIDNWCEKKGIVVYDIYSASSSKKDCYSDSNVPESFISLI